MTSPKPSAGCWGKSDLSELSLDQRPLAVQAIGGLLDYLTETQMNGVDRLVSLDLYSESQFMALDLTARRNLELTETMRTGEKKGTLLWVLDRTRTAAAAQPGSDRTASGCCGRALSGYYAPGYGTRAAGRHL